MVLWDGLKLTSGTRTLIYIVVMLVGPWVGSSERANVGDMRALWLPPKPIKHARRHDGTTAR